MEKGFRWEKCRKTLSIVGRKKRNAAWSLRSGWCDSGCPVKRTTKIPGKGWIMIKSICRIFQPRAGDIFAFLFCPIYKEFDLPGRCVPSISLPCSIAIIFAMSPVPERTSCVICTVNQCVEFRDLGLEGTKKRDSYHRRLIMLISFNLLFALAQCVCDHHAQIYNCLAQVGLDSNDDCCLHQSVRKDKQVLPVNLKSWDKVGFGLNHLATLCAPSNPYVVVKKNRKNEIQYRQDHRWLKIQARTETFWFLLSRDEVITTTIPFVKNHEFDYSFSVKMDRARIPSLGLVNLVQNWSFWLSFHSLNGTNITDGIGLLLTGGTSAIMNYAGNSRVRFPVILFSRITWT